MSAQNIDFSIFQISDPRFSPIYGPFLPLFSAPFQTDWSVFVDCSLFLVKISSPDRKTKNQRKRTSQFVFVAPRVVFLHQSNRDPSQNASKIGFFRKIGIFEGEYLKSRPMKDFISLIKISNEPETNPKTVRACPV